MTNLLQDGAAWLGDRLKDHAGRTVTYSRGATSFDGTAVGKRAFYDVVDEDGIGTKVLSYDFIWKQSDLSANSLWPPRNGDRITETINGESHVFEAMPLSDDEPCYQWMDGSAILVVIHTKRVD